MSLQDLLKYNQDDNFFAKMTERRRVPTGVYFRWLVLSEEIKFFEKSGLYGVAMKVAPLGNPEDSASADESLSVLHTLFFPRPAAGEQKEMNGTMNWLQMLDGIGGSVRSVLPDDKGVTLFPTLGPIPSRAKLLGKGLPGAMVDGVQVSGDAGEARGKERNEYVRSLQGAILDYAVKHEDKCPPLFEGAAFYAVAGLDDKTGKYVNLVTKVGQKYKDFSNEKPVGEALGILP
jgi:hypothetical protein